MQVPQRAIRELQGNFQVFIVDDSSKVEVRPVETGPRSGNMWVITQGIGPGDRVIVEGLQKVQPGQEVKAVAADFEVID